MSLVKLMSCTVIGKRPYINVNMGDSADDEQHLRRKIVIDPYSFPRMLDFGSS